MGKLKYILVLSFLVCGGCKKDKAEIAPPTAKELLTREIWVLKNYGFDDNRNGKIDPREESAQDCQKDNTFRFFVNGTGNASDNLLKCTGTTDQAFTWQLSPGNDKLDLQYMVAHIVALNKDELILSPQELDFLTVPFMIIYVH